MMMERPSTMFPSNKPMKNSFRTAAIVLLVSVAGCSLNPFANDDPRPDRTPVDRSSTAPAGGSSLDPNSAAASQANTFAQSRPVAQPMPSQAPMAAGAPNQYTVQEGDTLWDIASTFLRDPWYWPEVWYVNPQVENPHLIYPGDVLALVMIDGQERITNVRASTYRLSPEARITPLSQSVASIPYETVSAFLARGMVLEKGQAEDLPYILATRGDHIMAAAGNDVYIRGLDPVASGTRFSVVHIGNELVDPDDGRTVGFAGEFIGEGVLARGGDPATLALTDTNREALQGDRLVPETVDIPLNFFPKAPDYEVDGRIISVVDGVSLIGQYQVVVINRGARDGLGPGDVLSVYQTGETVRDRYSGGFLRKTRISGGEKVKLPDEEAGTVMVFKVYDRIGYGLVMEATSDIHVLDAVRDPI
jgi:hypothetical protein